MKNVKEPAPHVKAAQIEKEAVRALSVDEVEEALTKSTFGAIQLPQEDKRIHELEKDLEILKTECLDLREQVAELEKVLVKVRQENKDLTKTISNMKYAHDEEVRALEDDLAESKILNKKAGEYASMLDADSDAFETILELAKVIHGLAKSTESISLLIKDEVEGHV